MNKRTIKNIVSIVICMCVVFSSLTSAYAWSSNPDKDRRTIENSAGKKIAVLEPRMWISTLDTNFAKTKITFDAVSSTWVFDAKCTITGHVNQVRIKKTGLTGELAIGSSGADMNIKEESSSVFEISTPAANSYYRGMNLYNNTITRGVWGSLMAWSSASALTKLTVTGTSTQIVYLDAQMYRNNTTVTAYF